MSLRATFSKDPVNDWTYNRVSGVTCERTFKSRLLDDIPSITDFGASSSVTDNTQYIQAAITAAEAGSIPQSIYVPYDEYKFAGQLNITKSNIRLISNRIYANNYPSGTKNSPVLKYTGAGNEAAIKFYNPAASNYKIYHAGLVGICLNTSTNRPNSAGVHLVDCENCDFSEFSIIGGLDSSGYVAQGFTNGLLLEGTSLTNFFRCVVSYNTTNNILIKTSDRRLAAGNNVVDGLNFDTLDAYNCAGDTMRIETSADVYLKGYNFMEMGQNSIHVVQPTRATKVIVSIDNVEGTNNGDYSNPAYIHNGIHEAFYKPRFLLVDADSGNNQLYVRFCSKGTNFWQLKSDSFVEYNNNGNSNASTVCQISFAGITDICGITNQVVLDAAASGKCQVLADGFVHVGTNEYLNDVSTFEAGCLFDDRRANPQ